MAETYLCSDCLWCANHVVGMKYITSGYLFQERAVISGKHGRSLFSFGGQALMAEYSSIFVCYFYTNEIMIELCFWSVLWNVKVIE